MPAVSIALATCNGERFLPELLASLAGQNALPCQLVVSDDASEDDTLTILESFAVKAPFPVCIQSNTQRLGVVGNFNRAITACAGEYIAFADQDDVWRADKLEKLTAALAAPNVLAAFSDAAVVDENLVSLGYTMWQQAGFTATRRRTIEADRPWEVLYKDPVVTGATLIFRRELLPSLLPVPDRWMHDAWVAQIAASFGRLVAVDEPLIFYRQHANNVIGGRKIPLSQQIRHASQLGRLGLIEREIQRYQALQKRLLTFSSSPRRDAMLKMAEAKLSHLVRRRLLPRNRLFRLRDVLDECLNGNYDRYAKDWRNVLADLLMP